MAEGLILSLALTSHLGWDGNFNDVHPTLTYKYNDYAVGIFRNSLNHTSTFISKIKTFDNGVSVQYGLAGNYKNKTIPMLVVRKSIAEHANLMFMPSYDPVKNKPTAVIGVEFQY